jgi:hypothetical protein
MSGLEEKLRVLAGISARKTVKAVLLSLQKEPFCEHEIRSAAIDGIEFTILPDFERLLNSGAVYDIAILCCHVQTEETALLEMRKRGLAKLYCAWFWDNHHDPLSNLRTSMLADLLFPAHWHYRHYLNHPLALPGGFVPTYARQWSPGAIAAHYPRGLPSERLDGLFGGYGHYVWAKNRNQLIQSVQAICPDHALMLVDVAGYFAIPSTERLRMWAERKVHLIAPINRDISSRIFEALMTGQIPLVPDDLPDFDRVVPRESQAALPILRYRYGDALSAKSAWEKGVELFDQAGAAGVRQRFEYARARHSLTSRLIDFADFIRRPGTLKLASIPNKVAWERWL